MNEMEGLSLRLNAELTKLRRLQEDRERTLALLAKHDADIAQSEFEIFQLKDFLKELL
jgi:hypothetical protein